MNIRLDNVSKLFQDQAGIQHLSLEIKDGEFISLLGPSGCGKSTTLMLLAGLYKPTEGHIYFGDTLVNDLEPKDRNIGMVFQSYALYPHMTVLENIAFPLKQQKMPKQERLEAAMAAAKMVRLESLLDRKPSQLSGGQQQRVAMARALVKKPDLLLLDEPMSNLDTRLKIEMREEVRRLQKEFNITTIMVTHDQEEAMAMADRVAVLDKGAIQQFASPDQLFSRPQNLFVAYFMGNPPMNFLSGSIVPERGGCRFTGSGCDFHISQSVALLENGPRDVRLGIRPHAIMLSNQYSENAIAAELVYVEHLGREALVQVKVGAQSVRVLTDTRVPHGLPKRLYLKADADSIHIFDENTGHNLSLPDSQKEYSA
ncbi:ABC transporter ATP-binding protein [Paenibacillus polysaccharolyticus]|uniref:ABC transporter ATP-binding protein n=1 Tax=Paenibacillus polysaccharolyticus TaxID=582692 RepID=UPI0020A1F758|nr:ABC transporter ATP-binding protein [Paenibacillus polysaccharolyticus]MCP1136203.1 ABC transporter ATP-binding protein [Paenibacillus polysaccharolyticus]